MSPVDLPFQAVTAWEFMWQYLPLVAEIDGAELIIEVYEDSYRGVVTEGRTTPLSIDVTTYR